MAKGKTTKQPDYGCTHEELVKFLADYRQWYAVSTNEDGTIDSSDPPGPPPPPPGPKP